MKKQSVVVVLLALGLAGWFEAAGSPCRAQGVSGNPGVLPVDSKPYGVTYGEWSARHWQWLFAMPAEGHPLYESGEVDLSKGQSGPVWFLGGTLAAAEEGGIWYGIATRSGTVPVGKALFFPILDSECSTLEGNGTTDAELRACAAFWAGFATDLTCEVDGRAVHNLDAYRVQSPLYTYGPLPEGNILQGWGYDAPAGTTSPSVSDGYFLMLAPLSAGQHTVHFSGAIVLSTAAGDPFDYIFVLDVTYNLTVVPER